MEKRYIIAPPLVSVIVPVYNTGEKLIFLLDSILAQTFKDFELLLIDDGSSDGMTPQMCDEYGEKDSRVRVLHKQNGGVSSSRNYGLDHAQGTFIAFADHDDDMFPDNLQIMVKEIYRDEEMRGTYDLVICNFIRCKREEIKNNTDNRQKTVEISARDISEMPHGVRNMGYKNFVVWNQLFKKEIIDKFHIRFTNENSEDEMFATEYFSKITSFTKNDFKGYAFIDNENSLGSSHKYIASYTWICKMEKLYDDIIIKNELRDKDLYTYNWRIANRLSVLCMKGYYKDSHMSWRERMKVWNCVRNDKWLKERINLSVIDKNRRIILKIAKYRLYFIMDPIFQIYGKTNS